MDAVTRRFALALALGLAVLPTPGVATAAVGAPSARPATTAADADWEALPEADRAALVAPMRERWERASPAQRQRMLDRARFWASLSPEQKQLARTGVDRYRQARPEQRERLREAWQRLQAMPPEQREAARRTWEALTPRQRRAWLEAGGPGVAPPPTDEPPR